MISCAQLLIELLPICSIDMVFPNLLVTFIVLYYFPEISS